MDHYGPVSDYPAGPRHPIGHTALVTILLAHGAGSSGAAARALLGSTLDGHRVITVEDRSGDVEDVAARIAAASRTTPQVTHVIGISLGAHAVARWAVAQPHRECLSVCILPAWTGPPDSTAALTSMAAREIKTLGIPDTLRRIREASPAMDITRVLQMGWDSYTSDSLATAMQAASASRSIDALDLVHLQGPMSVVGWLGDPLHPAATALRWSAAAPRTRLAMAAYPNVKLLQQAVRSATGLPGRTPPLDPEQPATSSSKPHPVPWPRSLG